VGVWQPWECLKDQVKVTAYHLVKETYAAPPPTENNQYIIYTHWKVLIVDDEFAIIGSAGAERSGMTNDIDMSVGIYDAKTVTGIRKQLWSEHLNLNIDDHCLDDPLDAIKMVWPREAASCGRVRKYWPQDVQFWDYDRYIFDVFEPCGYGVQSKWCQ
jgi:phosphatidylserine/phosphatidylglycerophosphate/cardiolipin synthase-like enzyme